MRKIVYYNGFWYSAHSLIAINETSDFDYARRALDELRADLRLLALIFDVIHVPRSHLLTFQNSLHYDVISQYLKTDDFKYLSDNGILLSSNLPHTDAYSDTERILDRVFDKGWQADMDKSFIEAVKEVDTTSINSVLESRGNIERFGQYAARIREQNRKMGDKLVEIMKRAQYGYTPFLHELFVEELMQSDLKLEQKESVWRWTNSLYMDSGCWELGDDRRISYNARVEHGTAQHDQGGMLRMLYSPHFLQSLFHEELGAKYLLKFMQGSIAQSLSCRNTTAWPGFKDDVFEMFTTLTSLDKFYPEKFATYSEEKKVLAYKKHLLEEDSSELSKWVADLMILGTEVADPPVGRLKKVMGDTLLKWLTDWQIRKRMRHYREFWITLRAELDKGARNG